MTNGIDERIDVDREEKLAEDFENLEGKDIFLSFIAPYVPERRTPSRLSTARVTPFENIGIGRALENIEGINEKKKCHFLINSPGGTQQSSFQVACNLRANFEEIITYIPQNALSGGTIIALCSDEIVMGPSSILSPIDPQIRHKDDIISARRITEAFEGLKAKFEEEQRKESEIPFPFDTVSRDLSMEKIRSARGKLTSILRIGSDLLARGMLQEKEEEEITKIAGSLVYGFPDHSYPIRREEAREIGLNVTNSEEVGEIWDLMREWLNNYVAKASDQHIIRYYP